MKVLNALETIYLLLGKQILQLILIAILIVLLPNKNIFSINLAIWLVIFGFKIFNEKPDVKIWFQETIKLIAFTTIVIYAYYYAGYFGFIGLLIVIIMLAAWRIKINYELFDRYTTWVSDTLFKGKKEEFLINNKNNKNNKEVK